MRAGVLFAVAIDHDFRLNVGRVVHEVLDDARRAAVRRAAQTPPILRVKPTPETEARLAGHGMIFKARPDGFLVGIELEDATDRPRRPLASGVLRFAVEIADGAFRDRTAGIGPGFHLFSNSVGNERAGQLFLTAPVPTFSAGRAYLAGDLRAAPAGPAVPLFQAIRDTGPSAAPVAADWAPVPADTHDPATPYAAGARVLSGSVLYEAVVDSPGPTLTDATQWTEIGPLANQYATLADQVEVRREVFSVDVSAAASSQLDLRVYRSGETVPVRQTAFRQTGPLVTIDADLRGLPEGRYSVEVVDPATGPIAGLGQTFHLSSRAASEGWFGLIEIGPGTGSFALLDGLQMLRSPLFRIRFANRVARLRYVFPATQPVGSGAEVAPDPSDDTILVTSAPMPLTRLGDGVFLRSDDPATPAVSEAIRLPHHAVPALSKQGGQWFSDIHLSNLPPLT